MKRILLLMAVALVVAAMLVATAGSAFAKGPPSQAAQGLATASANSGGNTHIPGCGDACQ